MLVLVVTLAVALALPLQAAQPRSYAGRTVADVLQELQTPELRIIFSSDLVRPAMRVQAEPKSMDPKDIARAILEPHGLTVRPEPRGTLLVVALPRKAPPVSRRPPGAAAGTPQGKPADRQRGAIEAGDPGGAVLCSSRQAGVSSLGRAHARPFSCSAVSNQPGADF